MIEIKLPPLPPIPHAVIIDEDPDGGAIYGQDEDELKAWATIYAEQAVNAALASINDALVAAQQPLFIHDPVSGAVTPVGRPVGEWMPIETAPEGTMILCANMNAEEAREWAYVAWMSQGKVCCMFRCGMPTHWMPLPAPPKENNHAEGADQ